MANKLLRGASGGGSGDWTAFTPTGDWTTNTTYAGFYKQNGDNLEVRVKITLSGAPTASSLRVNMPSGFTIDGAKLPSPDGNTLIGTCLSDDDSLSDTIIGAVAYSSTTAVRLVNFLVGTSHVEKQNLSNTAPFTFAASDQITLNFSVPVE